MEMAWFTVPVIVIFFSLLIYGIGVLTKGGDLIVREATMIYGRAGQSKARLEGMVGVFTPSKIAYQIRSNKPSVAFSVSDLWDEFADAPSGGLRKSYTMFPSMTGQGGGGNDLWGLSSNNTIESLKDNVQEVSEKQMGQWDLAFFESVGVVDLEGEIEADFLWNRDGLTGVVQNNTSRVLREPMLLFGHSALPLGRDLLPGDSFHVSTNQGFFGQWTAGRITLDQHWGDKKSEENDAQFPKIVKNLASHAFYPELMSEFSLRILVRFGLWGMAIRPNLILRHPESQMSKHIRYVTRFKQT